MLILIRRFARMTEKEIQAGVNQVEPEAEEKIETTNAEKSKIYVQLISSFIICLPLTAVGLCVTWSSVAKLQDEKSDIYVNSDQEGWIASGLLIGSCVGPLTSAVLIDRVGRKWFLYATTFPFIASWLLIYFARSWEYILAARLIAGLSFGSLFNMLPLYLGELVETRIRGAASALIGIMTNVGCLLMYGIGPRLDRKTLSLISLIPSVVYLVAAPWIPDSPYYYLKKGKQKCTELTLAWLRRKRDNNEEIENMKQVIEEEKGGSFKDIFTIPEYRKALLILLLLLTGQQFSGMHIIYFYCMQLLKRLHITLDENLVLLVLSGVIVLSSLVASLVVDKLGRKPIYLISSYSSSLCMLFIGAYFLLLNNGTKLDDYSWAPLVAIVVFIIFCNFGLTNVPAIISSEIFALNVKAWTNTIANTYGAVLGMIIVKCYQLVIDAYGPHIMFFVFGAIELLVGILASVFMLETKRKTFDEIQKLLKGDKPKEKEPKEKEIQDFVIETKEIEKINETQ